MFTFTLLIITVLSLAASAICYGIYDAGFIPNATLWYYPLGVAVLAVAIVVIIEIVIPAIKDSMEARKELPENERQHLWIILVVVSVVTLIALILYWDTVKLLIPEQLIPPQKPAEIEKVEPVFYATSIEYASVEFPDIGTAIENFFIACGGVPQTFSFVKNNEDGNFTISSKTCLIPPPGD